MPNSVLNPGWQPRRTDSQSAAEALLEAISAVAAPARAASEKAYLKSDLTFLGASVPSIRQAVKAFDRVHPPADRAALVDLVLALWVRDIHEGKMAAVELLEIHLDLLEPADMGLLERLLRTSRTWAYVDSLAASVVGGLIGRFPEVAATLERWAADPDFWIRRSALLAHLLPLRRGGGDLDTFLRYAEAMLDEKEFFIRKAIGWVLRDTAKARPEPVAEWLALRIARVSGVTLREAVRHMPATMRNELVAAYKAASKNSR